MSDALRFSMLLNEWDSATNSPPRDFDEFWGDQFEWSALVSFAWRNIETRGISLRPISTTSNAPHPYPAYWSAALHLLGLGMGWTNIGEGLKCWRERGYNFSVHPILDFIQRHYGDGIASLEHFFAMSSRYEISRSLAIMSDRADGLELDFFPPDYIPRLEDELDLKRYLGLKSAAEKRASAALLFGGSDPLHLEKHLASSFSSEISKEHEPVIENVGGNHIKIRFRKYAGWALALSREPNLPRFSGFELDSRVQVHVETIGELGYFLYNSESGRWFTYSDEYGAPSLQWEAHLWGNPTKKTNS